jgi:hypothetical protein
MMAADRRMNENQTRQFLASRPAVIRAADDPPQPQCPSCGAFVAETQQFAPNVCGNCDTELPPKPDKAAGQSSARPWRRDEAWIDAFCESIARHTKAIFDIRDKQIAELQREVAALKKKAAKRAPKVAK